MNGREIFSLAATLLIVAAGAGCLIVGVTDPAYWTDGVLLVLAIRIGWNFGFLGLHPFAVLLGTYFTEMLDYQAFLYSVPVPERIFYDRYDKLMDMSIYVACLAYLYFWRKRFWFWRWPVPFLLWRCAGNVVFMIYPRIWVPVIFANVGSALFLFWAGIDYFQLKWKWLYEARKWVCLVFVLGKVTHEVLLHPVWNAGWQPPPSLPFGSFWEWFGENWDWIVGTLGICVAFGLEAELRYRRKTREQNEPLLPPPPQY